jgi:hypothetical protein
MDFLRESRSFAAQVVGGVMAEPELWALMQRVEWMRYRAEIAERARAAWTGPGRDLALDIALQWRQLAEQTYALFTGEEIKPLSPLKRHCWAAPSACLVSAVSEAAGPLDERDRQSLAA